jgi:hypothetical protein
VARRSSNLPKRVVSEGIRRRNGKSKSERKKQNAFIERRGRTKERSPCNCAMAITDGGSRRAVIQLEDENHRIHFRVLRKATKVGYGTPHALTHPYCSL